MAPGICFPCFSLPSLMRSWLCRLRVDFFQHSFQLGHMAREGTIWNCSGSYAKAVSDCFCTMLDPSAGSEEMLTGGVTGDRDVLQLFLLEQNMHIAKWGLCLTSQSAWASILHLCSWAPFQSEPVAHCRQKSGQANRTISLGWSPERHNAHVALTESNAVPTDLAHSEKFPSHSRS